MSRWTTKGFLRASDYPLLSEQDNGARPFSRTEQASSDNVFSPDMSALLQQSQYDFRTLP
ncbi:hypothetical protein [Ralstonia sp. 1138]|uniref:hypothetical protein n=1 Tax=Ralstonia sp. 1138 TaxID=3156423 RepID=UPI003394CA88